MAIYCDESCSKNPCCNHCLNYNFNGNENGAYTNNGFCGELKEPKEPYEGDECDEFICWMAQDLPDLDFPCSVNLIPFGSRVYGTAREDSDEDYICVLYGPRPIGFPKQASVKDADYHIFGTFEFQAALDQMEIHALEAYFHPLRRLKRYYEFNLDLPKLRKEISGKASNSWVKAKKKIDKEKDYMIGWKSLFHSFRILEFGIQIATKGEIYDFSCSNEIWNEILSMNSKKWKELDNRFRKRHKALSTEFRKVAPKEQI